MYRWIFLADSEEQMGSSGSFETAGQAEDWLGTEWRRLAANGIRSVVLEDGSTGETLYSMSLADEAG